MIPPHVLHQLRNTPVLELISAIEGDGFTYRRLRGSGRVDRHLDGRRMVIHYRHSGDTLGSEEPAGLKPT